MTSIDPRIPADQRTNSERTRVSLTVSTTPRYLSTWLQENPLPTQLLPISTDRSFRAPVGVFERSDIDWAINAAAGDRDTTVLMLDVMGLVVQHLNELTASSDVVPALNIRLAGLAANRTQVVITCVEPATAPLVAAFAEVLQEAYPEASSTPTATPGKEMNTPAGGAATHIDGAMAPWWSVQVRYADSALVKQLVDFCVDRIMKNKRCNKDDVEAEIGTPPRTLSDKLRVLGTTWRDVKAFAQLRARR